MDDKNASALEFLQELEARHSQVLDELDALNARIEGVLGEYAQNRQRPAAGEPSAEAA